MKIALFLNRQKDEAWKIARDILDYLKARGVQVALEDEVAKEMGGLPISKVDPKSISFRISLGGDGTILRFLHRYKEISAPLVGINLGGLGFLADVPISEIFSALDHLLKGEFTIEERLVIEGQKAGQEFWPAFNDIVFHRASNPSLVEISVTVDGVFLNTFAADGLIIATTTGSTAYSLAAGGPILTPSIKALALTPISPHTISNRPLVLLPQREIVVQYMGKSSPIEVRYDGIDGHTLESGEICRIKVSEKVFPLVSFPHHDYFSTLRTKLGWAGKLKS